jgi:hypothetical protein
VRNPFRLRGDVVITDDPDDPPALAGAHGSFGFDVDHVLRQAEELKGLHDCREYDNGELAAEVRRRRDVERDALARVHQERESKFRRFVAPQTALSPAQQRSEHQRDIDHTQAHAQRDGMRPDGKYWQHSTGQQVQPAYYTLDGVPVSANEHRHAQRDAHRGHGHGSDPFWPQEIDLRAVERQEQIRRERLYMHEQKRAQQQHVAATMQKLAQEQQAARQEQERRAFLAEERLRAHCPERAHPGANVKPTPELVQAAVRRTGITPDLQRLSTLSAAEREEADARTPAQRDIDQVVRWSHQEEQNTIAEAEAAITARHKREREEQQDLAAQHRAACATARADIGAGVTPANTPNGVAGGDDDDSSSGSDCSDGPRSMPLQKRRVSPKRQLERQA